MVTMESIRLKSIPILLSRQLGVGAVVTDGAVIKYLSKSKIRVSLYIVWFELL